MDGVFCSFEKFAIVCRIKQSQHRDCPWRCPGNNAHNKNRKYETRQKHRNQNTPRKEASLPFGVHFLKYACVDNGVIERKRDFEHNQKRGYEKCFPSAQNKQRTQTYNSDCKRNTEMLKEILHFVRFCVYPRKRKYFSCRY